METVGMFEAKAKLSEICERVAVTRVPIVVTRRGKPFVRIVPMEELPMSIGQRRDIYMAHDGAEESEDDLDFEPARRAQDISDFVLGD